MERWLYGSVDGLPVLGVLPLSPAPMSDQTASSAFSRFARACGCLLLLASAAATPAFAQTAITGITVSASDPDGAGTTSSYGMTWDNKTYQITSFQTATATGYLGSTASNVYIRRNVNSDGDGTSYESGQDNNNYSSIWVAQTADNGTLLGTPKTTLNSVLLNNSTLMGADNVFSNGSTAATTSQANIERVDFRWSAAFNATTTSGFVVFDRGAAGAHDAFQIAVFTAWDNANDRPTGYIATKSITSANYGSNVDYDPTTAGVQSNIPNYRLVRFNNDTVNDGVDNFTINTSENATNQGIGGVFISFADLGISANTPVLGYSIMANDVVTTNLANLDNWNNTAVYLTNTNDTNGGIDLMAFNGQRWVVPEPSTYGLIFFSSLLSLTGVRRWLRARKV